MITGWSEDGEPVGLSWTDPDSGITRVGVDADVMLWWLERTTTATVEPWRGRDVVAEAGGPEAYALSMALHDALDRTDDAPIVVLTLELLAQAHNRTCRLELPDAADRPTLEGARVVVRHNRRLRDVEGRRIIGHPDAWRRRVYVIAARDDDATELLTLRWPD